MSEINEDSKSQSHFKNIDPLVLKLKKLFEYYCLYGERLNSNILKTHKYIKLAQDSNIIDNTLNRTRLEIIYKSVNKFNQMSFQDFLNSLIKIAEYKFIKAKNDGMNKTKALNILISQFLLPRYEEIFNSDKNKNVSGILSNESVERNDNKENEYINNVPLSTELMNKNAMTSVPNIEESIFEKNVEEIIVQASVILYDLYKTYFSHEVSLSENSAFVQSQSFKIFFIFIKEFDLCPGLISKSAAFQIYQSEEEFDNISPNRDYYFRLIKNVDLNSMIKYNPKNGNILGQHFNFFKFIRVILKIAELGYEKVERANYLQGSNALSNLKINEGSTNTFIPSFEKLILTLERMELSEGFMNFEKKTSRTHSMKNTSIITKSLLDRIKYNSIGIGTYADSNMRDNISTSNILGSMTNEDKFKNLLYHNNYKDICEYTNYINETYGNELSYIFKGFCSFGDPLNTKYMRSKIFTKLLMEAKLIIYNATSHTRSKSQQTLREKEGLKMNEIDSIFIKLSSLNNLSSFNNEPNAYTEIAITNNMTTQNHLTSNNYNSTSSVNIFGTFDNASSNFPLYTSFNIKKKQKGAVINSYAKIDFNYFLIGIEVIARLIYPFIGPKEAIDLIIKENILQHLSEYIFKTKTSELKIDYLKDKQNNEELLYILGLIHKSFLYIYKYYSDKKGLMNFDQFMKFASEFNIFPDFLSKSKLNSFFKGVSQYVNFNNNNNNTNELYQENRPDLIENSLFVDIIALCAFEINFPEPEPSPIEKILFFVEKISHSDGPNKILKSKGSTRLTSGDTVNILEPFKQAFPQYFAIIKPKKEEFNDIMLGEDY